MGSQNIAKIILALGIVVGFTTLMYAEMGIPGGPPALPTLNGMPTFNNPFSQTNRVFTLLSAADGGDPPVTATDSDSVDGCTTSVAPISDWWGCVATHDGAVSNDMVNGASGPSSTFEVRLAPVTTVGPDQRIINVSVAYQCKTDGTTVQTLQFQFSATSGGSQFLQTADSTGCNISGFQDFTAYTRQDEVYGAGFKVSDISQAWMTVQIMNTVVTRFSFIQVTVQYSAGKVCTGSPADQANCYISQIIQFGIDAGTFLANLIVWVVDWVLFIVGIFIGILGVVAWFYAIPGEPTPIQVLIDAVMTSWAITLVLELIYIIRGNKG